MTTDQRRVALAPTAATVCGGVEVSVTKRVSFHVPRNHALGINGVVPPVSVEIHPTLHCNARCGFCFYSAQFSSHQMIDSEALLQVAHDLVAVGVKAVTVSGGGEPTLHPKLDSFMDVCISGGVQIGLITNGFSMPGSLIARLSEAAWVEFSLHSYNKYMHGRAFHVKDSMFDRVLYNVRRLSRTNPRPVISAGYVVSVGKDTLFKQTLNLSLRVLSCLGCGAA